MKNLQAGMSLVELMVSVTISMILSIAAISLYAAQMRTFGTTDKREHTEQEVRNTANHIGNLLRQAIICTSPQCTPVTPLAISYFGGGRNGNVLRTIGKSVQLDFYLPAGYPVWPNDVAPYNNNAIRLSWSAASGKVSISSAPDVLSLPAAVPQVIAGNANSRLINFDFWPIQADGSTPATSTACDTASSAGCPYGGYELSLTARVGVADSTYTNPLDPTDAQGLKNYRTITFTSRVFPRN